jgi:hypothetical protein
MPYVPLSKRVEEMTHDSFLELKGKEMLSASEAYMKALKDISGMSRQERLSYFYKNRSKLTFGGKTAPEHDDMLALCSLYGLENALEEKGAKKKVLKKLAELSKICLQAHKLNAEREELSPSSYDDLQMIAKRCDELIQENQ